MRKYKIHPVAYFSFYRLFVRVMVATTILGGLIYITIGMYGAEISLFGLILIFFMLMASAATAYVLGRDIYWVITGQPAFWISSGRLHCIAWEGEGIPVETIAAVQHSPVLLIEWLLALMAGSPSDTAKFEVLTHKGGLWSWPLAPLRGLSHKALAAEMDAAVKVAALTKSPDETNEPMVLQGF